MTKDQAKSAPTRFTEPYQQSNWLFCLVLDIDMIMLFNERHDHLQQDQVGSPYPRDPTPEYSLPLNVQQPYFNSIILPVCRKSPERMR